MEYAHFQKSLSISCKCGSKGTQHTHTHTHTHTHLTRTNTHFEHSTLPFSAALNQLAEFMEHDGDPVKLHQKFLRNVGGIEVIVELMKCQFSDYYPEDKANAARVPLDSMRGDKPTTPFTDSIRKVCVNHLKMLLFVLFASSSTHTHTHTHTSCLFKPLYHFQLFFPNSFLAGHAGHRRTHGRLLSWKHSKEQRVCCSSHPLLPSKSFVNL